MYLHIVYAIFCSRVRTSVDNYCLDSLGNSKMTARRPLKAQSAISGIDIKPSVFTSCWVHEAAASQGSGE